MASRLDRPRIRQKREAPTGLLMLGHGPAVSFRAAAAARRIEERKRQCSARLWAASERVWASEPVRRVSRGMAYSPRHRQSSRQSPSELASPRQAVKMTHSLR